MNSVDRRFTGSRVRDPGGVHKHPSRCLASAGKTRSKTRGGGNPWLAGTLGNIAACAARTDTFLGAHYRRIA